MVNFSLVVLTYLWGKAEVVGGCGKTQLKPTLARRRRKWNAISHNTLESNLNDGYTLSRFSYTYQSLFSFSAIKNQKGNKTSRPMSDDTESEGGSHLTSSVPVGWPLTSVAISVLVSPCVPPFSTGVWHQIGSMGLGYCHVIPPIWEKCGVGGSLRFSDQEIFPASSLDGVTFTRTQVYLVDLRCGKSFFRTPLHYVSLTSFTSYYGLIDPKCWMQLAILVAYS